MKDFLDGKDFSYEYRPPKEPTSINRTDSFKEELARITTKEERIKLAYENGIDTLEEYRDNKKRLQAEREHIQVLIQREENKRVSQPAPSKEEVLSRIRNVYDIISDDSVDYIIKGNLMREIFSEIIYDRKNNSLKFRIVIS